MLEALPFDCGGFSPGPDGDGRGIVSDARAESEMALLINIITGVRNVRGEMNLPPSLSLDVAVQSPEETVRGVIESHRDVIIDLARLKSLTVGPPGDRPKAAATSVVDDAAVYVSLEGILDFEKERQRLEKEIGKVDTELNTVSKKLSNESFLSKAPEDVVEKVKEKHRALSDKRDKLFSDLERIRSLESD